MADKNFAPLSPDEQAEVQAFGIEIYDIRQCAAILKVTERSVMNYLKSGQLKGRKVGGKWRFTKDDITQFITGG